jgi:hypothetical protein
MIFKMLPRQEGDQQIYARIDDDGLCRLTCTAEYPEFRAWLAAGNLPIPASAGEDNEPLPPDEPKKE